MGGLPRRATFVSTHRESTAPVLLVDAGNIFAAGPLSGTALKTAGRKAELIIRAMNRMGYSAAAIGEMDLYLGLEKLRELGELTDVRFVSANLTDGRGKTLFKPYLQLQAGPLKVLVLGLTRPPAAASPSSRHMAGIHLRDPLETAADMVGRLRDRCDLLVVLSSLGFREDLKLAREVQGIDIIIGGRDRRFMRKPEIVNGTLITSGYFQGRAVGQLSISYNGPVRGWVTEEELSLMDSQVKASGENASSGRDEEKSTALKNRRESAGRLTRYRNSMVILGPSWADDPGITSMIQDYQKSLSVPGKAE